jgi:hypothetical protein
MTDEETVVYAKFLPFADKHKALGDTIFVDPFEDSDLGKFRDLIKGLKSLGSYPWRTGIFREACNELIDWYDWNQFWSKRGFNKLLNIPSSVYHDFETEANTEFLFNVLDALSSPPTITKTLEDFM